MVGWTILEAHIFTWGEKNQRREPGGGATLALRLAEVTHGLLSHGSVVPHRASSQQP